VDESKQLKSAGLKITLPRLKILQLLEQSKDRHMSAEDVYKTLIDMGEEISLATVYRVLTQFEAAALIDKHNFEGGHAVFEIRSHVHHDHLVCVKCGRVEEFLDDMIEFRLEHIAKNMQFKITDHALNIYGICCNC
jgi:Fur family ferric uptake transcriptional regulator